MSKNAKRPSRLSFAGRDPDLRRDTPASLQSQSPVQPAFEQVRDPLIRAQHKAMEKTEAQRRGESGRGSTMVKLDKPFPELRPKNDNSQIRPAFNQAWLQEQRAARKAELEDQREALPSREREPAPTQEWTR
ncbi:Uncharacterised protein [Halioglobus japonicus]|nr:Uncharacterised protein [Halioglobus japonicus]